MKFEFPALNSLFKVIIIALVLSGLAYLVYPMIASDNLTAQRLFVYGVFSGALLGPIISATRVYLASSAHIESIFVGNLSFKASANALRELFETYGDVHAVRLMTDRATRRPRGFGFVEMKRKDARSAIRALNGQEFYGRELKVNLANERKSDE